MFSTNLYTQAKCLCSFITFNKSLICPSNFDFLPLISLSCENVLSDKDVPCRTLEENHLDIVGHIMSDQCDHLPDILNFSSDNVRCPALILRLDFRFSVLFMFGVALRSWKNGKKDFWGIFWIFIF